MSINHARIKETSGFVNQAGIMFLKSKSHGELVELLEVEKLYDPFKQEVMGRFHAGEEMQDPETFMKSELIFPSGEALPQCWLDPDYKHIRHQKSQATIA